MIIIDLFGIKRRKTERIAAVKQMLKERQTKLEERKNFIDSFLKQEDDKAYKEAKKYHDLDLVSIKKVNSTCPICGSKNRIHKFVRIQGKLDGHGSSYIHGGSSLFGGYVSGRGFGDIHGELDTHEVNECRDCGNQWEIAKLRHSFISDYNHSNYDLHNGCIGFLYRKLYKYFDEQDEDVTLEPTYVTKCFRDAPKSVLEYILYMYHTSYEGYGTSDDVELFSVPLFYDEHKKNFNTNPYLFEFTPEVWEAVQKLIGKIE